MFKEEIGEIASLAESSGKDFLAKWAFPYVPALLPFREIPAALEAPARLSAPPALFLCDGQGYAHPRRFGLACHLGVLTRLPSIRVAKSRLIGAHGPLPDEKEAWVPLLDGDETIGAVLRTRDGVAPVYVSVGHRVCAADRGPLGARLHDTLSAARDHAAGAPAGVGAGPARLSRPAQFLAAPRSGAVWLFIRAVL